MCSAIFCQCMSVRLPFFENLLCRGDSPFVIRSSVAHLNRKWESVLLKSKRKPCMLWSCILPEGIVLKMLFGKYFSVFYFMQFIIPQEKHIPDTSQRFLIAVLLPCECCLLKHGKTVWMLYRKTMPSPGVNSYLWNCTDFIQIQNLAKSSFRCFSWY